MDEWIYILTGRGSIDVVGDDVLGEQPQLIPLTSEPMIDTNLM